MLASTKHIQQGNTRLAYHLALGPGFRLISVEREGLSYDSSLAPASHAPSTGCLVLYVVLEGGFCPSHRFVATLGPSAWLVHEDHIDGALGHRPHSLLTFGQRFRSITLHIDAQHCRVAREPHGAPQELVLAPGLREACEHYAQQVHRVDGATWRDEARLLLQAIVDAGWIDADVMRTLSLFEAWSEDRPPRALTEVVQTFDLNAKLQRLAERAQVSLRQVDRLLRGWMVHARLPEESWRELSQRWRIKAAALLLSSEDFSVTDVARIVGYSNPNALTNVFSAHALPAPSRYRAVLASRVAACLPAAELQWVSDHRSCSDQSAEKKMLKC